MKSRIKNLPDGAKFRLSLKSPVEYLLNKLDYKRKVAIYTSTKSGKTFESGWGREIFI